MTDLSSGDGLDPFFTFSSTYKNLRSRSSQEVVKVWCEMTLGSELS